MSPEQIGGLLVLIWLNVLLGKVCFKIWLNLPNVAVFFFYFFFK